MRPRVQPAGIVAALAARTRRWTRIAAAFAAAAVVVAAASAPAAAVSASRSGAAAGGRSGARPSWAARQVIGGQRMASHGVVVNYPAGHARRLPRGTCSAYVIANAGTGQVLAAKDPHGTFGPASTLKVLTAVTMLPRLNPNATIMATRQAASAEEYDVGLKAGRRYQVSELFDALLLISANDAAVALVQASGSYAKGIALMNAEAHHLQAYDVVAKTPNGLPARGQVTSAYDQALIARRALEMPAFMSYDSKLTARFPYKPHRWETLANQNTLLSQYKGGIGGKIGWTIKSEATYIGLARRHGVTLIVTELHCTPLTEITSGEKLLNWGFAMNGKVTPVGALVPPLVTVAAHPKHAARQRKTDIAHSVAESRGGGLSTPAGLAIGGGIVLVAVVVLGAYVMSRRARRWGPR